MKVMYERVAGIDVHKDMVKVAIRSPADKPWTRKTEILEFRTFYGVLQQMARELLSCIPITTAGSFITSPPGQVAPNVANMAGMGRA
jgi:hypothetical protein